jgi:hypothetical protein
MNILETIIEHKKTEVAEKKTACQITFKEMLKILIVPVIL